ncbi:DUF4262 domain-containing protein [Streptomyces sp. N2A]|uniref:DUF4262 domain-containing protein n=1 Tax=Streptomyces sp. N2A TaxID=3073936 RepID=UPI0037D9A1F4
MVPEDEIDPGSACTIGFSHTRGAPELAMLGLDVHAMHRMLNRLGAKAAAGAVLADGQRHSDVADGRRRCRVYCRLTPADVLPFLMNPV